jgi:biotin synthase
MSPSSPETSLAGVRLTAAPRNDWTLDEAAAVYAAPFNDLVYAAQWVHRQHFDANAVQISTLLSI